MLRSIRRFNDYDPMLRNILKPVNTDDGDTVLGRLRDRQVRLVILIHLLESRKEQAGLKFRELVAAQQTEKREGKNSTPTDDDDTTKDTRVLAGEIRELDRLIPLLEGHLWSEIMIDFCDLPNGIDESRLAIRLCFVVVAERPKKRGTVLRMSSLKAALAIGKWFLSPRGRTTSPT